MCQKTKQNTTKYIDTIEQLPKLFKTCHGYHSYCYKRLTAIKSIDCIPIDLISISANTTRSSVPSPPPNTIKVNVLLHLIFCNKGRKKYQHKWAGLFKSEGKDLRG